MMRWLFALLVFVFMSGAATAAPCAGFPYSFVNGTIAQAPQVNANFTTLQNCITQNSAASGANSDITQISGLVVPLPPSEGGTGATALGSSLTNLGGALGLAPNAAAANLGLNTPLTTPATITVGPSGRQFTTLVAALNFLANTIITAPVTIQIDDGTYSCPGEVAHPQGALISIIGDTTTPANVIMQGSQANFGYCFKVQNDHALGFVDGMTVQATDGYVSPGQWQDGTNGHTPNILPYGFGFWAYMGGTINVGYHVVINKYYYAERGELGGAIFNANNGSTGPIATDCGDVCYHTFNGGHIECRYCHASYSADINSGLGAGYLAEMGGSIVAPYSFASNNAIAGFETLNGGSMWAQYTLSGGNGQYAYHAFVRASIDATQSHGGFSGPAWAATTGYGLWSWVANSGKLYVETVSTCISGSSGGPTGTTSVNADGSCNWQYFGAYGVGTNYAADRDGTIAAYQSASDHAGGSGFYTNGGTIDANSTSATFNGAFAWSSTHIGKIYGPVGFASWAPLTAYSLGLTYKNGSNVYVETNSNCTSAAAGGPTGTGSSIVDGSCLWNYIGAYVASQGIGNGTNTPTADGTSLVNF